LNYPSIENVVEPKKNSSCVDHILSIGKNNEYIEENLKN
jgi:hypothetical protein